MKLTDTTTEDSGEYYCEASNSVGSKKSEKIHINIYSELRHAQRVPRPVTVPKLIAILALGGSNLIITLY